MGSGICQFLVSLCCCQCGCYECECCLTPRPPIENQEELSQSFAQDLHLKDFPQSSPLRTPTPSTPLLPPNLTPLPSRPWSRMSGAAAAPPSESSGSYYKNPLKFVLEDPKLSMEPPPKQRNGPKQLKPTS